MTVKNILSRIEYTVIIDGVEKPGYILYSTWNTNMLRQSEKVSGYKPETMFDPVARDNYQKYITIAYYAGLIPAKVIETRTNEVVDGCYTFTVETMGNLDPENDNTDNQPEEAQHGEIMEAVAEYAVIVEGLANEYDNTATVETIRKDHPELDFMDDDEITDILTFAETERNKMEVEAQHGEIMEAVKEPTEPTKTTKKKVMKLDKEEFLKTEFGEQLRCTVDRLHYLYDNRTECANLEDWEELHSCCCRINELLTGLGVFLLALKQFYGIEYNFNITDEYYGVCTKDGSDWLFKVERKIE